ncbi:MAG: sigma-70 family RNA polymerase sigma factor [Patescibacteria group bacterium]
MTQKLVYQRLKRRNLNVSDSTGLYLNDVGKFDLWSIEEERNSGRLLKNKREILIKTITKQLYKKEFKEFIEFRKEFLQAKKSGKKYWFIKYFDVIHAIKHLPPKVSEALNGLDDIIALFMEANLRLVVREAQKKSQFLSNTNQISSCLSFDDLIQDGNLGLHEAIQHFNPDLGFKFSTYAITWIRQALSRSIGDNRFTIRVPIHMFEVLPHLERLRCYEKNAEIGDQHSIKAMKEIQRKFEKRKISLETAKNLMKINPDPISLDSSSDTAGNEYDEGLGSRVKDVSIISQEDLTLVLEKKERVSVALDKLSEREKTILIMRFNLNGEGEKTFEEVGRVFKITRERVRQLEKNSLRKLRTIRHKLQELL